MQKTESKFACRKKEVAFWSGLVTLIFSLPLSFFPFLLFGAFVFVLDFSFTFATGYVFLNPACDVDCNEHLLLLFCDCNAKSYFRKRLHKLTLSLVVVTSANLLSYKLVSSFLYQLGKGRNHNQESDRMRKTRRTIQLLVCFVFFSFFGIFLSNSKISFFLLLALSRPL